MSRKFPTSAVGSADIELRGGSRSSDGTIYHAFSVTYFVYPGCPENFIAGNLKAHISSFSVSLSRGSYTYLKTVLVPGSGRNNGQFSKSFLATRANVSIAILQGEDFDTMLDTELLEAICLKIEQTLTKALIK